jgi:hypothetical protein
LHEFEASRSWDLRLPDAADFWSVVDLVKLEDARERNRFGAIGLFGGLGQNNAN